MLEFAISIRYMLAGYIMIIGVLVLYLISLILRWRNLKRDYHTLIEIQKKD
jgi:hypothetical protein